MRKCSREKVARHYQSHLSNYLISSPPEAGVDIESVWDTIQTAINNVTDKALEIKSEEHKGRELQAELFNVLQAQNEEIAAQQKNRKYLQLQTEDI